jgi:PKD repeat protein
MGFQPGALLLFATLLTETDANAVDATADGFAIAIVDGGATYCQSIASEQGAATSNTQSRADTSLVVTDGAGVVKLAGTITLDSDGFDINWTTVQGTARYFIVVGIEGAPTVAGPVVAFAASTQTPAVNEDVTFTDLSSDNGSAITAWAWDFGDGETATEENPTHAYGTEGTFTVKLTVTNANGSETLTKVGYIVVDDGGPDDGVGPYDSLPTTNYSPNARYGDDPTHAKHFYHEHALDLDGLNIDYDPEDTTSGVAGKLRIVNDKDNSRLKVILPSGAVLGYIDIT